MSELKKIVEATIFMSETPLSVKRMKELFEDVPEQDIIDALQDLVADYGRRDGGLYLAEVAGGFQFRTVEAAAPWIQKLRGARPAALSQAALETLAVVAYRQPVLKSEIEQVRGVDVSGALKGLLDKNLVRIVGRKDVAGRPIMYGTTRRFLEVFNLNDLSELPTLREMKDFGEEEETHSFD